MKIYTKTGDAGQTGLFSGTRIAKYDLRLHAYGTLDELNSHLGLLRDQVPAEWDAVRAELERSFGVEIHDSELPPAREELLARVAGCDGLVTMLTDRVDAELLDSAGSQLRVVSNCAIARPVCPTTACSTKSAGSPPVRSPR